MSQVEATLARATLRAREEVAAGTMAFHFEKPPGFAFKPGQALDLVLPAENGVEPLRHAFSIVSAPFEEEVTVATRMRASPYKAVLAALQPGAPVGIDGPFGALTLARDPSRDAVFIAGGIGITPFMSMLRQAVHDRSPRRFALVYSNRRPEDAAFLEELERMASGGALRLVATMTDMAQSSAPWRGETRAVDAQLLAAAAKDLRAPIYYLAGPPAMVAAMRKTLEGAGIDDEDIRSEDFFGY